MSVLAPSTSLPAFIYPALRGAALQQAGGQGQQQASDACGAQPGLPAGKGALRAEHVMKVALHAQAQSHKTSKSADKGSQQKQGVHGVAGLSGAMAGSAAADASG